MMHMGLSLLTVAVETGCDHIPSFSALIALVKDEMCKNLFAVSAHFLEKKTIIISERPVPSE